VRAQAFILSLAVGFPLIALGQTGAPWPEADRLCRSDPRWLGGDAAFSVDLGSGRVLWLFGDSFIAGKPNSTRRQAAFIRNSVAIQNGYDPSHASIRFYCQRRHGKPADFVQGPGANWYWPMHGIRLGNRLLLFFMRMASDSSKASLGFQSVGWDAFIIDDPDAEPADWEGRAIPNSPEPTLSSLTRPTVPTSVSPPT